MIFRKWFKSQINTKERNLKEKKTNFSFSGKIQHIKNKYNFDVRIGGGLPHIASES